MPYHRSFEIEQRIAAALRLIRTGRYSTPRIAEELNVSIPTVSRLVSALRTRGHDIRAEKQGSSWRYVLTGKPRHSPHNRARGNLAAASQPSHRND
jgi:transposase